MSANFHPFYDVTADLCGVTVTSSIDYTTIRYAEYTNITRTKGKDLRGFDGGSYNDCVVVEINVRGQWGKTHESNEVHSDVEKRFGRHVAGLVWITTTLVC